MVKIGTIILTLPDTIGGMDVYTGDVFEAVLESKVTTIISGIKNRQHVYGKEWDIRVKAGCVVVAPLEYGKLVS